VNTEILRKDLIRKIKQNLVTILKKTNH